MNRSVINRDDLSFTHRDEGGRMINWPRNNPGVSSDWEKGMAFFDGEVTELASHDETEAFDAIRFAILGMSERYTNLEMGFADRVAHAALIGLRHIRSGAEQFTPADIDD